MNCCRKCRKTKFLIDEKRCESFYSDDECFENGGNGGNARFGRVEG
jgi:hypothetical protein